MRMETKYHLGLIVVLLISLVIIGATSYTILHRHAKEEVIKQAAVLMEAALAMRKYTINEIKPLLALQNKRNFLPQSVPSYAATQNFEALRETHSEYRYKEATLNPTNPRDRATDWEADVIQEFRNNADADHITLVRDTPLGATLYFARPIKIKNQGCLTCHGMIEDAPETMISLYGPANGFGWKMDEVVGSQIVSVPLSLPVARANETFFVLISIVTGVFVILYLMFLFFFKKLLNNPDMPLTTVVEDVAPVREVPRSRAVAQNREIPQNRAAPQSSEIPQSRAVAQNREIPQNIAVPQSREISNSEIPQGSEITQSRQITQGSDEHSLADRKVSDEIPENSINLDLEDSDELVEEEQTISLQKMYQKHGMEELLLEGAFDIDEAFTEPTSKSSLDRDKK